MADTDSSLPKKPKRVRDAAAEYAKQKEYQAAYRAANKEKMREYQKAYSEKHAEKIAAFSREYYAKNKELVNERRRASIPQRLAATARAVAWQKANADRVNANHRAYGKKNPHIGRAKTATRNAALRKRKPIWFGELDAFVVAEASHLAAVRTTLTGIAWDVDHALPVRGKVVSGLHVWNNIQVLPARINRSKGNTITPEMLA